MVMRYSLRYGDGDTISVDLPPEHVVDYSSPQGEPVHDAVAEVRGALASALDFPPWRQASVRGDRIVLELDRGILRVPVVVAGVVETLLWGPAEPQDIHLVVADEEDLRRDPLSELDPTVQQSIGIAVPRPGEMAELTYLA